jgi:hypothetical protein
MPESPKSLRVFLCHAHGDKPAVRDLYEKLSESGYQPWLDEEDLLPGQEWEREIRLAVKQTDVVLVCMSRASITKQGFVQKEIRLALDVADEQPEGTIFVVPVKLEECEVPERLSRWQWVRLHEDHGYAKLVRALEHRALSLGPTRPSSSAAELRNNAAQRSDSSAAYRSATTERDIDVNVRSLGTDPLDSHRGPESDVDLDPPTVQSPTAGIDTTAIGVPAPSANVLAPPSDFQSPRMIVDVPPVVARVGPHEQPPEHLDPSKRHGAPTLEPTFSLGGVAAETSAAPDALPVFSRKRPEVKSRTQRLYLAIMAVVVLLSASLGLYFVKRRASQVPPPSAKADTPLVAKDPLAHANPPHPNPQAEADASLVGKDPLAHANPPQPNPQAKTDNVLQGCICGFDEGKSTVTIVPWNENKHLWDSKSARVFVYQDKTTIEGENKATVADLRNGKAVKAVHFKGISVSGGLSGTPFEVKRLSQCVGRRATLHWVDDKGTSIASRIELALVFGGESMAASIGTQSAQTAGPDDCPCRFKRRPGDSK